MKKNAKKVAKAKPIRKQVPKPLSAGQIEHMASGTEFGVSP